MSPRTSWKHEILIVEDNPGDARLLNEAFSEVNPNIHVQWAHDGDEAVSILRAKLSDPSGQMIDLILLDLKLPRMDGLEVLKEVKSDSCLRSIPIIVLSSSMSDRDVEFSYGLHANSYVVKPGNLENLLKMVETINEYWFSIVELPGSSALEKTCRR